MLPVPYYHSLYTLKGIRLFHGVIARNRLVLVCRFVGVGRFQRVDMALVCRVLGVGRFQRVKMALVCRFIGVRRIRRVEMAFVCRFLGVGQPPQQQQQTGQHLTCHCALACLTTYVERHKKNPAEPAASSRGVLSPARTSATA